MSYNHYASKEAQRDKNYREAWESPEAKAWLASLPKHERRKLESEGLLKPLIQNHGSGMSDEDIADSPLAREEATFVDQIDEPIPAVASPGNVNEEVMDVLRRFLGEVLSQKNARLTLECMAVACGLTTMQGESMTSIAKRHGVSRAAVSKRCVDITEKLNLPPSRTMRSSKARTVYRKVQKEIRKLYEHIGN